VKSRLGRILAVLFASPELLCLFEETLSSCDLPTISVYLLEASLFENGRDGMLSTLPLGEMLVGELDVDPSALEELDIKLDKLRNEVHKRCPVYLFTSSID
jgi:hypothetical protein